MARITKADVEYVAELARIALDEDEKELFVDQLGQILAYAQELAEVSTDNIEPTAHAVPMRNVFRSDRARPSLPTEKVFANAPREQDGHFYVPRILEE